MKNTVKFCTLMIVLLVTTLSLLVLTLLSFSTARADYQVALRYADTVKNTYKMENKGQEWLSRTDKLIREGKSPKLSTIVGKKDDRHLEIAIKSNDGGIEVIKWTFKAKELHKQGISNLFRGV